MPSQVKRHLLKIHGRMVSHRRFSRGIRIHFIVLHFSQYQDVRSYQSILSGKYRLTWPTCALSNGQSMLATGGFFQNPSSLLSDHCEHFLRVPSWECPPRISTTKVNVPFRRSRIRLRDLEKISISKNNRDRTILWEILPTRTIQFSRGWISPIKKNAATPKTELEAAKDDAAMRTVELQ